MTFPYYVRDHIKIMFSFFANPLPLNEMYFSSLKLDQPNKLVFLVITPQGLPKYTFSCKQRCFTNAIFLDNQLSFSLIIYWSIEIHISIYVTLRLINREYSDYVAPYLWGKTRGKTTMCSKLFCDSPKKRIWENISEKHTIKFLFLLN